MKKTISILLAVIIAVTAAFVLSTVVFADDAAADPAETPQGNADAAPAADTPTTRDPHLDDRTETEPPTTTAKVETPTVIAPQIQNLFTTTLPNSVTQDNNEVVTNAPGQTAIVDEETTAATTAATKQTPKKAAKVNSRIPNTGSSAIVPAFAALVLISGTVAVVKTKKDF